VVFRAAFFALSALALGCQITPYPPRTVSLRVTGDVTDAQVTIDDIPIGALGYVQAHGVALPPGRHRITVEKAGYFPWDAVVEAKDDTIHLQIHLDPVPD
jgi:hypothetical protein